MFWPVDGTGRRPSLTPPSRPGPTNPLCTFLYNFVLPRNAIPCRHAFFALRVPFCDPQITLSKLDFKSRTGLRSVRARRTRAGLGRPFLPTMEKQAGKTAPTSPLFRLRPHCP